MQREIPLKKVAKKDNTSQKQSAAGSEKKGTPRQGYGVSPYDIILGKVKISYEMIPQYM